VDAKGTKQREEADRISLGTLGMDAKSAMEPEGSSEEQFLDEDGSVIRLTAEGELPEKILESLLRTDPQTYAQCRGDGQWEKGVTNQFLVDMIEQLKSYEQEGPEGEKFVQTQQLWMCHQAYQHHEQLPMAFGGRWPSWNSDLDNRPW